MNYQSIKSVVSTLLTIALLTVSAHGKNLRRAMEASDLHDTAEFTRYVQNVKMNRNTYMKVNEGDTRGKSKSIDTSKHDNDAVFEDTNGSGSMDSGDADTEECFGNGAYVLKSMCDTACCTHSCIKTGVIFGQC